MRKRGFEPLRSCDRQPLKLVRLPFRHFRGAIFDISNLTTNVPSPETLAEYMADAGRRQQKTETLATLDVGKLRLERRNGAPKIFARAYVQGKLIVRTTGEQTLSAATKVATDWYLELRDRMRRGERLHGRSFAHCADAFLKHADLLREVSLPRTPSGRPN